MRCNRSRFLRIIVPAVWVITFLVAAVPAPAASQNLNKLLSGLAKAISQQDIGRVEESVEKIVQIGSKRCAEALFSRFALKNIDNDSFRIIVKGLSRLDSGQCIQYYKRKLRSSNSAVRVLVAEIAGCMSGDKGVSLITGALQDKSTNVVQAALSAVAKRKPKEAVPVLIDLVEDWHKRSVKDAVFYDIQTALRELTGENLTTPEDWRKWWQAHKETFDPQKVRETGKTRRVLGSDDDPDFFGVPVSSKNAVFVIDISASMRLVHKDDIPGLTAVSGVDKTQVVKKAKEELTAENRRLAKFWSRIEMAKRNLIKVLAGLRMPTKFNIVAFHTQVMDFMKRSKVVSRFLKKKAFSWIRGLKARRNTATYEALKHAFMSDRSLNTIYFLSDGVPSKDGVTEDDREKILKKVLKLNRFRKVKIHTFGFHPFTMAGMPIPQLQKANSFLKKLAKKTGGTFTAMKVDPDKKPPPDFR